MPGLNCSWVGTKKHRTANLLYCKLSWPWPHIKLLLSLGHLVMKPNASLLLECWIQSDVNEYFTCYSLNLKKLIRQWESSKIYAKKQSNMLSSAFIMNSSYKKMADWHPKLIDSKHPADIVSEKQLLYGVLPEFLGMIFSPEGIIRAFFFRPTGTTTSSMSSLGLKGITWCLRHSDGKKNNTTTTKTPQQIDFKVALPFGTIKAEGSWIFLLLLQNEK